MIPNNFSSKKEIADKIMDSLKWLILIE
jgi:hypothetical protein